jgi:ribosomal protein L32
MHEKKENMRRAQIYSVVMLAQAVCPRLADMAIATIHFCLYCAPYDQTEANKR